MERRRPRVYGLLFMAALILGLLINAASCGEDLGDLDFSASENFSETVAAVDQESLKVEGINGRIEVTGAPDAESLEITGELVSRSSISEQDAREHLDDFSVEVTDEDDQVTVKTLEHDGSGGDRSYSVQYRITVPDDWQVFAEQENGDISVTLMNHDVSLATSNGSLEATECEGDVEAETTNGSVSIFNIVGNVDGKSENGRVQARVTLPEEGMCRLETNNGSVDLAIPVDSSATLSAQVNNGEIKTRELNLENESSSRTTLAGIIGGGSATIELKTNNGNININGF